MFKVALKNLLARKFRLVTTGLAVLIGVAFMSGGLVLTDTIGAAFDDLFGDISQGTDVVVRSADSIELGFGDARARLDVAAVDRISQVEGVAKATAEVNGLAQILDAEGELVGPDGGPGPPALGLVWDDEAQPADGNFHLDAGREPKRDDEVVIDGRSAEDGDIAVGDRITVLTKAGPTPVTVVGLIGFKDQKSSGGASLVGFTLDAAQRLLTEPGKVDSISVIADDGVTPDQLRTRVQRAMGPTFEVITGATVADENRADIQRGLGFFDILITVFAGISLFVGSFIIYNTFSILVAQRTKEMALMRAIGASRRQVLGALLLEALIVGVLASLVGLLVGIALAASLIAALSAFGFDLPTSAFVLTLSTVITALIVGVVVTVAAALFPARRGATIPPVAAMRDVAIEGAGSSTPRLIGGALLTIAGMALLLAGLFGGGGVQSVGLGAILVFLGVAALGPVFAKPLVRALGSPLPRLFGITGHLARENAMRNPKRTSRTAAALLIGVALVGTIAIVASSVKASFEQVFDDQFAGDFVVRAGGGPFGGGNGGVSPRLAAGLREQPEIGALAELRGAAVNLNGKGEFLSAIDAAPATELFDIGITQGDVADLGDDGMAVTEEYAEDHGLRLGSRVPVRFPGEEETDLIVGLIYTKDEIAGSHWVDLPVFEKHVGDNLDQQLFINAADGVELDDARRVIDEATKPYPSAEVEDRQEFLDRSVAMINTVLTVIYALLGLAVFIALLGIGNTLALSIVERTRELGLLRAVGMTRRQLRSTIRWEAILIAVFGTLGGLLVGAFFGWAIVEALKDEGFRIFRLPAGQLAVIALIGSVVGVFAAILPARRAARLDVLRAIATE